MCERERVFVYVCDTMSILVALLHRGRRPETSTVLLVLRLCEFNSDHRKRERERKRNSGEGDAEQGCGVSSLRSLHHHRTNALTA